MSGTDDQPDRYDGEETVDGIDEALADLFGDETDADDETEWQALQKEWAAVDDNPRPAEDLGYDGQEPRFLPPHSSGWTPYLPAEESQRFATRYILIQQTDAIGDLTEWA